MGDHWRKKDEIQAKIEDLRDRIRRAVAGIECINEKIETLQEQYDPSRGKADKQNKRILTELQLQQRNIANNKLTIDRANAEIRACENNIWKLDRTLGNF